MAKNKTVEQPPLKVYSFTFLERIFYSMSKFFSYTHLSELPLKYSRKTWRYVVSLKTQKEITSQTDKYLVILSSKTYVFEDKLTEY